MQDEDVFADTSPPRRGPTQTPLPPPSSHDTHNKPEKSNGAPQYKSPHSPLRRKDTAPGELHALSKPLTVNNITSTTTTASLPSLPMSQVPPPSHTVALPLLHAEMSSDSNNSDNSNNSNSSSLHASETELPCLPRQYLLRHRMGYSVVRLTRRQRRRYTHAKLEEFLFYKEQKYNAVNVLSRFCVFVMLVLSFAMFAEVFSVSSTDWAVVRHDEIRYSAGLFAACEGNSHIPCHHRRRTGRAFTLVDSVTRDVVCEVSEEFVRRYVGAMWSVGIVQLVGLLAVAIVAVYITQRPTRSGAMLGMFGLLLLTTMCGVVNSVLFPRFSQCERRTCAALHETTPRCVAQYQWAYQLYIAATALLALCWALTLCMYSYVINIRTNATVQLCRVRQEQWQKNAQLDAVAEVHKEQENKDNEEDEEEVLRRAATITVGEYSVTERPKEERQRRSALHRTTQPHSAPPSTRFRTNDDEAAMYNAQQPHYACNGSFHGSEVPSHNVTTTAGGGYYSYSDLHGHREWNASLTMNNTATMTSMNSFAHAEDEPLWRTTRRGYYDGFTREQEMTRGSNDMPVARECAQRMGSTVYTEDGNEEGKFEMTTVSAVPQAALRWSRHEDPAAHLTRQQSSNDMIHQSSGKVHTSADAPGNVLEYQHEEEKDKEGRSARREVERSAEGEACEVEVQDESVAPHSHTAAPSPYTPLRPPTHLNSNNNSNSNGVEMMRESSIKRDEGDVQQDSVCAQAHEHAPILNATPASSNAREPFQPDGELHAEPLSPLSYSATEHMNSASPETGNEASNKTSKSVHHAHFAALRRQLRPLSLHTHHTNTPSLQHSPATTGAQGHNTPATVMRHARHVRNYLMRMFSRDYDPSYLTAQELGVHIAGADDWVYDDRSDMFYSFALDTFFDPLWEEYYNNALKTWQKDIHQIVDARRLPD